MRLGVNIDHVATLRQVRGGTTDYPSLVTAMKSAVAGGAEQITIHLREDRRHIQDEDLKVLSRSCPVDLNLEMAVSKEILRLAKKYRPAWVCFVPEKREELTTEGGLNVSKVSSEITKMTSELNRLRIQCSYFIEPDVHIVNASAVAGAQAVEFHTGHWVLAKGTKKKQIWQKLVTSAEAAHALGLRVHAGHGLDYEHTAKILQLPHLLEVNIGHSLICYSLEMGLTTATKKMVKVLAGRRP